MNSFFEIDYEIEAKCDEYGDFPLQCAALLFDLLDIRENVVIKNQYSIKTEKAKVIEKYIENKENSFYECSLSPEGNYCIWLKQSFSTNQELVNILKLQGIYLSYIVPNDSFDWEDFLKHWKNDEKDLLLSGQAMFICNVIDEDRTLNINFNADYFSTEKITNITAEWEKSIKSIAKYTHVKRNVAQMRSKHGNKHLIRLCFL